MTLVPIYSLSTHLLGWRCSECQEIFASISATNLAEDIPAHARDAFEVHLLVAHPAESRRPWVRPELKAMFREALGREMYPEEERFFGAA